ncbi:Uma2 family endonuclease [Fimbriimonas ginsengisoli]|uniref:Putative restriction endonuclease domain-containing protein n=1 Tax=Fimbriimonas ginsengisoli Gsoil 348 TaxID=661478 RepID=A0A068NK50_FIMGI|nr:Uma2 family endonuclease [Fimbriimonas ginsengisoli]AIE83881.1 hypothetical protein OP10G_0513 [Fimbriimonas ginsengisoli Gsoil 348]
MASLMGRVEEDGSQRLRWNPEALQEAINAGVVDKSSRYEILDGELYEKIGQNWPHAFAVDALLMAFRSLDPERFHTSIQNPLIIGQDSPEPDLKVLKGSLRMRRGHPTADQALLIVEVSDSTLAMDRKIKGPIYAAAAVPVYWIVDLSRSRVEVFSRPESGAYAETRIFEAGEEIPPAFEGAPSVPVSDLLAPEK